MTKTKKSSKASVLSILSLILFVIAIIMALISTSKVTAKKEELLKYSEKSYIEYEIKKENILFNFNYTFFTDKKISLDYDYDVTALILAKNKKTGKQLYYSKLVLVPTKKVGLIDTVTYDIKEPFNINYKEYNDMLKEKIKDQDLDNIDASLVISLNTNTTSNDFSEKLLVNANSTITIPLLSTNIEVTKKELNETNSLIGIKNEVIKNKKLFSLAIIMTSIATLTSIAVFILFLINPNIGNSYNKEYKKVAKMVRDYDELIKKIYKMPSLKDKKIIEVSNIDDFITLRDKYELTITMVDKDDIIVFVMIHNNKAWQYRIEKK